jgi:lipid-A-disaccharide synthase
MHIFISAGEPSGDLHGANLVQSLRQLRPDIECVGFGGERMEAAGARLLYPLCRLALMGFLRVLLKAHVFVPLLFRVDRWFREQRPDAVVLIDYPGFNWWVARRAHAHGIPVFYFVPPQLWAWAGWRVRKMQRWVDHVLCALPFEEAWYRDRGVHGPYIGHPYFDELAAQRLDEAFLTEQRTRPGTVIALLPGSRNQEIVWNLDTLLRAAARVHAARPDIRFLVACLYPEQARRVERAATGRGLPIEVHAGRTPEIIHLAHACAAVSGSVGLELLYQGKPSVVVYRARASSLFLARRFFMTCRYISLVNLLAERELFPEFLSSRCEAEGIAAHLLRWLDEPHAYAELCDELTEVRRRVAEPGACARAARFVLEVLASKAEGPSAAA